MAPHAALPARANDDAGGARWGGDATSHAGF
jgi:hypothetical protein